MVRDVEEVTPAETTGIAILSGLCIAISVILLLGGMISFLGHWPLAATIALGVFGALFGGIGWWLYRKATA